MIRINLLPRPKTASGGTASRGSDAGPWWFILYSVLAALSLAVLLLMYQRYDGFEAEQLRKNTALEREIEGLQSNAGRLDEMKKKLERATQLEKVVTDLEKARLGPARVLVELSRILSVGGGPTIDLSRLAQLRRDNPVAGFNSTWDPRRLWLTSFKEEKRECGLEGVGRTNEDVAEYLRRLSLSQVFESVRLERTEAAAASKSIAQPFVAFELACKVNY